MRSENLILIADAGSTKTSWCLKSKSSVLKMFTTSGVNPSVQSVDEIEKVFVEQLLMHIPNVGNVSNIFFYGAGCTPQRSSIVKDVFVNIGFSQTEILIESDILGAAKAVCGNSPGVVGILGTGSNSCRYDGEKIVENTPSLGFILGDEGSGAYIGKRLVSDCLKGILSERLSNIFLKETKLNVPLIIQKVYREPAPNRYLAGLSRFCVNHLDEQEIILLLVECFEQFFRRNILRYDNPSGIVHLVGSIASVYKNQVEEAASRCSLKVGHVIKSPIDGLIENLS